MTDVCCDYCRRQAEKVTGQVLYPHRSDLQSKIFYLCTFCDAYVGCHPGTDRPLGRLANSQLRKAKSLAHTAFDPLWTSGRMTRTSAYGWLAQKLEIPQEECHIGMFDVETCERVVIICASIEWDTQNEQTKHRRNV